MLKRIQWLVLVLITSQAAGETPASSVPWQPSVVAVGQTVPGQIGRLFTKLEIGGNGDAKVIFETSEGPEKSAGTILVVSGRWMLVNGMKLSKGREIDTLDIAALNSQLVLNLLSRALPGGPPAPGKDRSISTTEENEAIQVATTSASGIYAAPWTVKGVVASLAESNVVNYSLDFMFHQGRSDATLRLEGFVSNPEGGLEIPDSMSLANWTVYKVGPYEERGRDGTILDYGARETNVAAKDRWGAAYDRTVLVEACDLTTRWSKRAMYKVPASFTQPRVAQRAR